MRVLDVDALQVTRGGRLVVRGLTLTAERGELVAVMGPSGAGKTTVLRAIAGLDPIAGGRVHVDGVEIAAGRRLSADAQRALHRRVGFVFQFHHLFANMTAVDNVALAPIHVLGKPRAVAERRAHELLASLGVGERAAALPHELSGGEAQRVAIARALAVDPPLLLMDEPTASLDPARRGALAATLTALAADGRTILVATHDQEFARACACRVVTIQ